LTDVFRARAEPIYLSKLLILALIDGYKSKSDARWV